MKFFENLKKVSEFFQISKGECEQLTRSFFKAHAHHKESIIPYMEDAIQKNDIDVAGDPSMMQHLLKALDDQKLLNALSPKSATAMAPNRAV